MVDTSWAERRQRMVKCKIHGLHFDPEMSTGCARCLREVAKTQPQRAPQLVVILLCILGMAFILFYLFGPGRGTSTDLIDLGVASSTAPAADRLDPEPYREQVEALETALFRTPIDETDDMLIISADIAATAADLSSTIVATDPTGGLTAADLIARLGQSVPTDQVVQGDIQKARDQWLRLRKQQLLPADWLFSPEAAGAAGETTSAAGYSDVASSLRASIEDGLAEVQTLADAAADTIPGTPPPVEGWRSFARDWRQQLDSLESRLPARPSARDDGRLLAAIQDLEKALAQARALAAAANPPDAEDSRFNEAIDMALRAQQGFDELQ